MKDIIYPLITPTSIESALWTETIYNKLLENIRNWDEKWKEERLRQLPNLHLGIDYVYKYKTINPLHPEWIEEELSDKKLYSPSISELNDPLEAAFVFGKTENPVIANAVKMMMKSNWYGCICFSRDPICVQMWAHYAASHSGFCVEYYRPSSFLLSAFCKPVLYRRGMPEIEIESIASENNEILDKIFWTKSEAWEYEAEWRLRYPRASAYTAPSLIRPHGVIFGLRTPDSTKNLIRSYLTGDIRFGQIIPAREPYRIRVKWE